MFIFNEFYNLLGFEPDYREYVDTNWFVNQCF